MSQPSQRDIMPPTTAAKRVKFTPSAPVKSKAKPTLVRAGKQPFAPQRSATLVYNDLIPVTLSGTGTGQRVFSCNGLFDPDVTGTGHQPLYFDQMMTLYNHYVVTASRIKVRASTRTFGPILFVLGQNDDTTFEKSAITLSEQHASSAVLTNPLAGNNAFLSNKWSAQKTFGINPQSNPLMNGTASANPNEGTFWIFQIQDQGVSQDVVDLFVQIEYDVLFYELKDIIGS